MSLQRKHTGECTVLADMEIKTRLEVEEECVLNGQLK